MVISIGKLDSSGYDPFVSCAADGGEDERSQDPDDGDDHQKLNQSEAARFFAIYYLLFTIFKIHVNDYRPSLYIRRTSLADNARL